jgi:hypothetical protein
MPLIAQIGLGICQLIRAKWVELTGFEPVTPSLRKMRSKPYDQGKRPPVAGLWSGCGASDVMHREMW